MAEQRVVPALRTLRYETSGPFYTKGLGFEVEWEHRFEPDFPVFVSLIRDGMRIFLTEHTGDCQVGGLVHFYIPNVDALYDELRNRGIPVTEPPNDFLPSLRTMTVTDPDGNQLRFLTRRPGSED